MDEMKSITMRETATLRFVRKLVGFHLMTVLQQKWIEEVDPHSAQLNKPLIEEWRDVPVEQE